MSDAISLIQKTISLLGFPDAEVTVDELPEIYQVQINVPVEDSGMLIGHHGETINSLKKVLTLMVSQDGEDFKPVHVNVNDYREQREKSLQDLADSAVDKAIESHQEILLPPLPSYERRIIHLYVEESKPEATTYSEGSGRNRRLVVRPVLDTDANITEEPEVEAEDEV